MMAGILELTSLPNLHPALVHFPIALTVVALLFDFAVFVRPRWVAIDRSAAALWGIAAASAGVTYAAGRTAADGAGLLPAAAEATLAQHADAAWAVVVGLVTLATLRAWLAWRDLGAERVPRGVGRVLVLVGAMLIQGVVAYTADLGGALVYRHGVAVSTLPAGPPAAGSASGPASPSEHATGLSHLDDGSLVWRPRPGNESVLGWVLEPLGPAGVRVETAGETGEGLSLVASSPSLLALPGTWGDVQVEARIDASGFDGTVAIGARIGGPMTGGLFRIRGSDDASLSGEASLTAWLEGKERQLATGAIKAAGGERTIALSAVGRHWRGFVDGRTIVHGHVDLPATGRVAILLDGTGTARILEIRVSPIGVGRERTERRSGNDHEQH